MNRIRRSLTAVAVPATLTFGLLAGMGAGTAQAAVHSKQINQAQSGTTKGSGSSSGGRFTSIASGNIHLSGQTTGSYNVSYTPPNCWLQPKFLQPKTYQTGDPSGGPSDADSYWFWFGNHFSSFRQLMYLTGPSAVTALNQGFRQIQNKKRPAYWTGPNPIQANDVWWVPGWLNTPAGWTCVANLVSNANMSDGFITLEPPAPPGSGGSAGQITSLDLAELARAAIGLPTLQIVTSPRTSTVVNLPTYVSVNYQGPENPSDEAEVFLGGAPFLWAKVHATLSNVQITSSAPSYRTAGAGSPGQACAAVNGKATSACSITFTAPSGATPYTITVSVTWKVTWSTSAGNGGTFANTPPVTQSSNIVVQEIQTQT